MQVKKFQLGQLNNNVYVVVDDKANCLVIDPTYDTHNTIANYIEQYNLNLQAILLTHGHFDHCGGADRLAKHFNNCPIYCHSADKTFCTQAKENMWQVPCENCHPTNFYSEGDNKIGDFTVEVLFTPGHTPGGVCLIIEDSIFTGDTLFKNSVGRTDLAGGDCDVLKASLERLKNISADYKLYAGHGEDSTLKEEKYFNYFLNNDFNF